MLISWHKSRIAFVFSMRIWRECVSERKVNPSLGREKLQRLPAAGQIKTIVLSFQLHEKRRKKKLVRRACSSSGVNQIGACDFLTNCAILLRHEKIKKRPSSAPAMPPLPSTRAKKNSASARPWAWRSRGPRISHLQTRKK